MFSEGSCCLLVRKVQTHSIIWALKILMLLVSVKYRFMFSPFHCTAGFPLSGGCNCFPRRANHYQQPTQISHQRCLRCAAPAFLCKGLAYITGNGKCGLVVWFLVFFLCKSDKGSLNFLWAFLYCSGFNHRLINSDVEEIFHFTSSY